MRLRSVMATLGAAVVAVTALGPGTAAFAYPPGQSMQVSAVPGGVDRRNRVVYYHATVTQAQPGCKALFRGGLRTVVSTVGPDGTAAGTVAFSQRRSGTYRVVARTVRCDNPEVASTSIVISRRSVRQVEGVRHDRPFQVELSGWDADSSLTVWATDGRRTITQTAPTDGDGDATVTLTLPTRGSWAIVVAQDGESQTIRVNVR